MDLLEILFAIQWGLLAAMTGVLAARFLLPRHTRDSVMRVYHGIFSHNSR